MSFYYEKEVFTQMDQQIVLPEWENLYYYVMNYEAGTLFEHEVLASKMQVKSCSQKYYNLMQKAIDKLTEIGIRLSNVKGTGYKILTPDEWVVEAKSKIKKGGKSIQEAQYIVSHAPYLQMSEVARNECLQLHDSIVKHKFLLSGGVISITDNTERKQLIVREGNKL